MQFIDVALHHDVSSRARLRSKGQTLVGFLSSSDVVSDGFSGVIWHEHSNVENVDRY